MISTRHIQTTLLSSILVLVPLVYYPPLRDYTLGPKLFVFHVLVACILGIWLSQKEISLRTNPIFLPATVFVLFSCLSIIWSTHTDVAILEASKMLSGYTFFFILTHHINPKNILKILKAAVYTSISIAILGICDYINWRPFAIPSAGLPSATLGFRNIAAMYAIQILPWAFLLFVFAKKYNEQILSTLSLLLLSVFLIYTRTRGAWLGIALATLMSFFLTYRFKLSQPNRWFNTHKKRALTMGFIAFFLLCLIPSGLQKQGPQSIDEKKTTIGETIQSVTKQGADRGRFIAWKNTMPLIFDHFVAGVGMGNWSVYYPLYDHGDLITFTSAPERPHNSLLTIWSETGSIGLIAYLWLCATILHQGIKLLKHPDTRYFALAGLASFIAIFIHGLFSFPNERLTPTLFFWLVPGVFVALNPVSKITPALYRTGAIGALLTITLIQCTLTWRFLQFDSHLYKAVRAEESANWMAVSHHTQKALSYGAFHAEGLLLHGYAHNAQGNYSDSFVHYQNAIKKRPNDIQLLNGLAIAAQNTQHLDIAHDAYTKALKTLEDPNTRYNLASLLLQLGKTPEAIEQYTQVLNAEGPSLDLYYHLSLTYFLARQHQHAQNTLKRAFEFAAQDANAHFEWIEALYRKHRNASLASAFYRTFIQFWPQESDRNRAQKRLNELQQITP